MNFINTVFKEIESSQIPKKKESIVPMLVEHVNNLEKLQLSPIYDSDTKSSISASIANCFIKIINHYYLLLMNNINTAKISKGLLNENACPSFYAYLVVIFHNWEIVKFVQINYAEVDMTKQALMFLLLSLMDRSMYDNLLDIYKLEIYK